MYSFNVFVLLVVSCVAPILAATLPGDSDWTFGARVFLKTYTQCQKDEASLIPCLKQRALTVLERAASLDHIPLVDGITIERDSSAVPMDPTVLAEGRSDQLDEKLMKRAISFLQTHTLRFDSPETEVAEGRGKDKDKESFGDKLKSKLIIPLMLAMLMGGKLMALVLGGLALLAGKAFIISKLALILSLALTIRKLFSNGHSAPQHETSYHPVSYHESPASNHISEPSSYYGHHRRSLYLSSPNPAETYAHSKAYNSYFNAATETNNQPRSRTA